MLCHTLYVLQTEGLSDNLQEQFWHYFLFQPQANNHSIVDPEPNHSDDAVNSADQQ